MIEAAHDDGIAFTWPGIEPVQKGSCRDLNLLYSAEIQPYCFVYGEEAYPTLEAKAAYLFYHLTTAHIFGNGNKRTAVLCLDTFLHMNGRYLTLNNTEMYTLAKDVAASGANGRRFHEVLQTIRRTLLENSVPFSAFRAIDEKAYRRLHRHKWALRKWDKNQVGYPLTQR